MMSETDFADNKVSTTFRGALHVPLLNALFYGLRQNSRDVKVPLTLSGGMNALNRAEGGTSAFSWVAYPSSRFVFMAKLGP